MADVVPGKHTTRKGWLTKDFHFPQSPFTCDIDDRIWRTRDGRTAVRCGRWPARRRGIFRRSIRRYSDPFSFRLLFAILGGRAPSLLELPDRPSAYEDVGRLCRWGMVISALRLHDDRRKEPMARTHLERRDVRRPTSSPGTASGQTQRLRRGARRRPRAKVEAASPRRRGRRRRRDARAAPSAGAAARAKPRRETGPRPRPTPATRAAPRCPQGHGQEGAATRPRPRRRTAQRRTAERRTRKDPIPFPDRRLTRSAYEQVFLKLVSGGRLRIGRELYTPVGMKGWYHAILRRDSDGKERLLSVDQLLKKLKDWR